MGWSDAFKTIDDGVKDGDLDIKFHDTKDNQESNMTISSKSSGERVDFRVETHDLNDEKDVRHGNVDHWDSDNNKVFSKHLRD